MRCFVLHLSFAAFFAVAWRGLLHVDQHAKSRSALAPAAELSARYLTNWTFVRFSLFPGNFIRRYVSEYLGNIIDYENPPGINHFAPVFMTCLTILCTGYLVNDVLRLTNLYSDFQQKMKHKLDFYFYSIVGPMCIFVPIVFWGLYLSDKEFINVSPEAAIELIMPPWVNHSIHTVVAMISVLQAYFNKVSLFELRKLLPTLAAYNLVYIVCVYVTYYEKQIWVYGFLRKLKEPFRLISLLLLTIWAVIIGYVFNRANNWHCSKSNLGVPISGADRKRRD